MLFEPRRIIVHHSATRDSGTVSWGAIRHYHTDTLGWRDIGYHALCEWVQNGNRSGYECFYGRPETIPGAHTRGHNGDSLGFCFVGNYDDTEPDAAMLEVATERVLLPWMIRYGISADSVFGHRLFSPKSCPGNRFDMSVLRAILRQRLGQL